MSEVVTNDLVRNLEALLYVSIKPLTIKGLAQVLGTKEEDVEQAVEGLRDLYSREERGMQILRQGNQIQMMTNPASASAVSALYHDELAGELTRPSLETLTIIAYRGPIRKLELDQIRGVNCALILRNLLLRGLIEASDDEDVFDRLYSVTLEFLRHLGISSPRELPDYNELHEHQKIEEFLSSTTEDTLNNEITV